MTNRVSGAGWPSPTYRCGFLDRAGAAVADPARLAWGLAALADRLGVRRHEHTELVSLSRGGDRRRRGAADRARAADGPGPRRRPGTNAHPPVLRRLRHFVLPVYDHVATEPLSAAQLAQIGWAGREGIGDGGHQFHYYRLTSDNRIPWGGYDANYHRAAARSRSPWSSGTPRTCSRGTSFRPSPASKG